ncbi:cation diffusion facilitator family transporter [Natranaerovirga pectinivora]|uniref:Cation diffusion facilitator family transporter n=1 Tax=Natranaerovirga pectinivora TaxID=682400 RepID=A0A4V2V0E2_9FIRM|nr:cation diffusion facilitator family transporter [Natranaerovirga pectinivora]TCT15550.1 cation diffusion facilitator family transporter [Natranaerovirga pectinivora]
MNRSEQASRITKYNLLGNGVLIIIKLMAGILGKSGAMLADGLHSITDFLTDVIVLISFKITKRPPDKAYHYGYGKFETLATLFITLTLFYAGFIILRSGVINIFSYLKGEHIDLPKSIAIYGALLSIIIKEVMYRMTIKVGKRIQSQALVANAWHHRSDAFSSVAALIGISAAVLLGPSFAVLDPIVAIIVSLIVFKIALKLLYPSINELMEGRIDEEKIKLIIKVINENKNIKGYHKLRTRKVGRLIVIDFHISLNKDLKLHIAHDIAHDIENELKEVLGEELVVTIHIEPHKN